MRAEAASLLEQCGPYLTGPDLPLAVAGHFVEQAVERYSEPWRFHHTVRHLADVTGFLVDYATELQAPRPTLWAAVNHDEVYIPQAPPGVNEELSARLNEAQLEPYLPINEVRLSGAYIRKTAAHEWDGKDMDLAYLLDADLKILGAPPDEFEEYDENIGREYSFVDPAVYKRERTRILQGFYDQGRIYITYAAHRRFEMQAKVNLERKLGELTT